MAPKLKILLLGPVSSGKSTVGNVLANGGGWEAEGQGRATRGLRILEFEAQGLKGRAPQGPVDVELWDSSGDSRYQDCWPAIQNGAHGIVFVYSDGSTSDKTCLETLYKFFVEEPKFPENCCLVVKNERGSGNSDKSFGNPLPNLDHLSSNLEQRSVEFRKSFNSYLSTVLKENSDD